MVQQTGKPSDKMVDQIQGYWRWITSGLVEDFYIPLVSKVGVSDNFQNVYVLWMRKYRIAVNAALRNYKMKVYPKIPPDCNRIMRNILFLWAVAASQSKVPEIVAGRSAGNFLSIKRTGIFLEKSNKQKIMLQCYTKMIYRLFTGLLMTSFYQGSAQWKGIFEPENRKI